MRSLKHLTGNKHYVAHSGVLSCITDNCSHDHGPPVYFKARQRRLFGSCAKLSTQPIGFAFGNARQFGRELHVMLKSHCTTWQFVATIEKTDFLQLTSGCLYADAGINES